MIKMINEGGSLTMRHVSRTHRFDLDWVFLADPTLDLAITTKYVNTAQQLADILTHETCTRDR